MSLLDLLILNLGARFTKLLIESWLGKGAETIIAGDMADLLKGRFQSKADQKKAQREFEELGDRMARELLPLFENAEKQGHVNAEAVVFALESTLSGLTNSSFLIQKDLDPGAILSGLKRTPPLPVSQFSRTEVDLYERALERAVRHLVEVASRLPQFEEMFAARSLQQLSRLTSNVDEILAGVRQIEATVGQTARDQKAGEYEIHYRLAVQRNLDYLEIFGIDLPPESRVQKLSVAYISLNLENQSGGESQSFPAELLFDRLSSDDRLDSESHSDEPSQILLAGKRDRPPHHHQQGRLLMRGDAGSGKSTLLRWAAMEAAFGRQDDGSSRSLNPDLSSKKVKSWRARVPFLVLLRQCKLGSLPSPDDLPELVTQAIGSPPADWVRSVLQEGNALLLLDGVDEIPNAHRDTTRRGIADLVSEYPETYFVISTRPRAVGPDWLKPLGFQEARINPLSELDRVRFIDRWHEAVAEELQVYGKVVPDLQGVAESLKGQLEDNPEVARLATNPLLCAMICALHRDRRQKLPERQRQLCEDLCHALLHRRERESGLDLSHFPEPYRRLDYPQKRAAVQELAHYMVLNEYSSLSTEEAQEQIGKALKQFPGHSAADARVVTESLVERSGILREESPGEISFIHNAFKELLAGDYFAGESSVGLLAGRALDPTWQPVILFAVAADIRGFATKIIKKILEPAGNLSKADLRARQLMALRCRAAALYIDEEVDRRVQELTTSLFPPRNMEDAEALASGGNTAVPFLIHRDTLGQGEAAASIRALRLIGTSQAREALRSFVGDRRETVISELAQAVNPLEIEWTREQLLAGKRLPEGIATQVADLAPLAGLDDLQGLILDSTQVTDLSPLAGITNLQSLVLDNSQVADLSPLKGLHNLQSLYLVNTKVVDLSPLAKLHNLENLDLSGTRVADLSPLAGLNNLESLALNRTQVADLSPLAGLTSLRSLYLNKTRVTDPTPVLEIKGLHIFR